MQTTDSNIPATKGNVTASPVKHDLADLLADAQDKLSGIITGSAKAARSPLPWNTPDEHQVSDDYGNDIAYMAGNDSDTSAEQMNANTEFIVRAVNNHDALVSALDRLISITMAFSVLDSNPAVINAREVLAAATRD